MLPFIDSLMIIKGAYLSSGEKKKIELSSDPEEYQKDKIRFILVVNP